MQLLCQQLSKYFRDSQRSNRTIAAMLNSVESETVLKLLVLDTYECLISKHSEEPMDHITHEGQEWSHHIFPLKQSFGGLVQYVKDRNSICLTTDQARYIYEKVEKEGLDNVEMIKQEIKEDKLDKDNELGEENPYQDMIINSFEKKMLIGISHKWSSGQYLIMLITMFSIIGILEIILN